MDYRALLIAEPHVVLERYAACVEELVEAHRKAGWLAATITKDQVRTFESSLSATVAAREREARAATVSWEAEADITRANIAALEIEMRFLERLLG